MSHDRRHASRDDKRDQSKTPVTLARMAAALLGPALALRLVPSPGSVNMHSGRPAQYRNQQQTRAGSTPERRILWSPNDRRSDQTSHAPIDCCGAINHLGSCATCNAKANGKVALLVEDYCPEPGVAMNIGCSLIVRRLSMRGRTGTNRSRITAGNLWKGPVIRDGGISLAGIAWSGTNPARAHPIARMKSFSQSLVTKAPLEPEEPPHARCSTRCDGSHRHMR